MITEYNTRLFRDPENPEKNNRVDELFNLADKDIRYAFNKIIKVREKVVRLSTNQLQVSTTEDVETVELISTFYNAALITELENIVSYTSSMLEDLRKYQKSRLGKIDAIAETIEDQIQQKHQEREECDDEYPNIFAQLHYSEEMKQLDALKRELLLMKEKTQNTPERDAA